MDLQEARTIIEGERLTSRIPADHDYKDRFFGRALHVPSNLHDGDQIIYPGDTVPREQYAPVKGIRDFKVYAVSRGFKTAGPKTAIIPVDYKGYDFLQDLTRNRGQNATIVKADWGWGRKDPSTFKVHFQTKPGVKPIDEPPPAPPPRRRDTGVIPWDELDSLHIVSGPAVRTPPGGSIVKIIKRTAKAVQVKGPSGERRQWTVWFPKSALEPAKLGASAAAYRDRDPGEVTVKRWFLKKMKVYHDYILGIAAP